MCKFIPIVLLCLGFLSCNSSSSPIDSPTVSVSTDKEERQFSLDWIVGNWTDTTLFGGKVTFAENWIKNEEGSFSGEKFQISNGNNSSSTELGLVKTEGKYYYSIIEREGLTAFVQDSLGYQYISFVNTTDKFPANLSYHLNQGEMSISFSGMANGVYRRASFRTVKLKN